MGFDHIGICVRKAGQFAVLISASKANNKAGEGNSNYDDAAFPDAFSLPASSAIAMMTCERKCDT